MGSSSRHSRKRKGEDRDSEDEGRRTSRDRRGTKSRSRDRSESPKDKRSRHREKEPSPSKQDEQVESMSVEETNKMRAKLGLAPLEDNTPKIRDADDGSKIITEDGMEFRHKKAENLGDKKREQETRDKIEAAKKKRQVYEKVLKAKNLADSDSDDDASGWVAKLRKQEEEKKRADEREKMLNEMDAEFGVDSIIAEEQNKKERAKKRQEAKMKRGAARSAETGGLVVGHSKEAFLGMTDQILVLDDKSVLDDGDETLINPNLLENERHSKNVELKKRKDTNRGFDEDVDQFGNPKNFGILSKYDEELEGGARETFRLDEGGSFDLDKEKREAQIRRNLEMAGKTLVNMDTPKYKLASEFYTQEEMVSFRKSKKKDKGKMRKRGKILKADDLVPDEPSGANLGSRSKGRRRQEDEDAAVERMDQDPVKKEDSGDEDTGPVRDQEGGGVWKKATKAAVDLDRLKHLAQYNSDEEDSEEEFGGDLGGIIIDDDAQDELSSILDKTRKLKQKDIKQEADPAKRVHEMVSSHTVKMEVEEDGETGIVTEEREGVVSFDSTREYCRNIGENLTYGLAGNRTDAIDVSELQREDDDDKSAIQKWKAAQVEKEHSKSRRKEKKKESKGGWLEPGPSHGMELDSDDERELEAARELARERGSESDSSSDEEEYDEETGERRKKKKEYENVLGNEADVTKGVGAMLKLAAQKGYLVDPNANRQSGQNLDHLRNQSKTQIEAARYDIEDKYAKKLDRLGTTGRGPIVAFSEKKDYNPEVTIEYVDNKGRVMERKDAYRELSYKFHGRNPGKKQTEKRMVQIDKREKLKQMNSSDTPLGTLTKQLKKQEQLQSPYLVLSGSGRSDHTSIKKD